MGDYELLSKIKSPADVKRLDEKDLAKLCSEIREKLIETVSLNGGHLSPNLGVVELTVALHRTFNLPKDSIVWDVGHQSYTHKLLTGRFDDFYTLRQKGGISGFPKRSESKYDDFNTGHSSTSISAAYGIARAKMLSGDQSHTVAVIGDGSFTGGLAFEAMNNAGRFKKNFIVILNDNKMSISKNVGAFPRYLTTVRIQPWYIRVKKNTEKVLSKIPLFGRPISAFLRRSKSKIKNLVYKNTLFDCFGFTYIGPIDGHDIPELENALSAAKKINSPVLLHVVTKKGKGYLPAEENRALSTGTANSILIRANLYLLIKVFLLNLVTHFVNLRKKIKKSVLLPPQWQREQDLRNFLSIIKRDFLMSELRKNTP